MFMYPKNTKRDNLVRIYYIRSQIICFLILFSLSGCINISIDFSKPTPPSSPCPIEVVIIEEIDLPKINAQWHGGYLGDAPSRVLASSASVGYYTTSQGGLTQNVYSFWYLDEAKDYFEDDVRGWFTKTDFESDWITPDELRNIRVQADTYELRCSYSSYSGNETCRYFARYEKFVLELSADLIAFDHEQYSELIQNIDLKLIECFEEK